MSANHSTETMNEYSTRTKILNWVKTSRVQTAMVTTLALWIGYITVSNLTIRSAVILGVIGLLVHLWGFTLNEVEDYQYDAEHGDLDGHPIAQGKVHAGTARYFAWMAGIAAVGVSALSPYPIAATVILVASFAPGYAYNKWSKTHWWSNMYLAMWASLMVLAGALYAGAPNILTSAAAIAVGIQIFIQVVEGDLKDIRADERSLTEQFGVVLRPIKSNVYNSVPETLPGEPSECNKCNVVKYPSAFTAFVYTVKIIEVALLLFIVSETMRVDAPVSPIYIALLMLVGIAFFYSLSLLMVLRFDRDRIKRMSSVHELVSVVALGLAVFGLQMNGALLIIIAPIFWYLCVNYTIHSGALNPDV